MLIKKNNYSFRKYANEEYNGVVCSGGSKGEAKNIRLTLPTFEVGSFQSG